MVGGGGFGRRGAANPTASAPPVMPFISAFSRVFSLFAASKSVASTPAKAALAWSSEALAPIWSITKWEWLGNAALRSATLAGLPALDSSPSGSASMSALHAL